MRRKKRGASLIVVIIIFMFLATVSTAMLSMILANYKARVAESKRVENLYASDSGLDVTYNVIGKNFDAAVKYGYYQVEAMKNHTNRGPNNSKYADINEDIRLLNVDITKINTDISNAKEQHDSNTNLSSLENERAKKRALINEDEQIQQVLINEEFKRAFNNFIQKINTNNPDINASQDENIPANQLNELIIDHSYIDMSKINDANINQDKPEMIVSFGIKDKYGNSVAPKFEPVEISAQNIDCDYKNSVGITASEGGHYKTVTIYPFLKQGYYNIAVTSSFYSEKLTGNDNDTSKTNERQLAANFKLSVPEYNDIYNGGAGGAVQQYLATQDRAITVNGNMNLSEVNGFHVNNGEIYVGGTTPSAVRVSNRSYEKYSGGMMIYDSSDIKFNEDVVTRNTLNLRSGANVTIGGNLYGRNIYVGGSTDDSSDVNNINLNQPADKATLNINSTENKKGQVIIDNDLGLKATNSNITINDFFGINDKNITDDYGNPVDRTKNSSSIIVNSNDDSSNVIIKSSAWIMGTAHINTNETDTDSSNEYQTGESGAVKGNYIAYTVPLDASEKLGYYNPLQLLDEPNVFEKTKHFVKYWSAKINNGINPSTGGIQWPITENDGKVDTSNIHTVGALVYELNGQKKVVGSTYNLDEDKNNPGSLVYQAQADFASKVYRFDQSATKPYDYDKTMVTDFSTLVDTSKIASSGYTLENPQNNGEHAIFNGDNKPLIITTSNESTDEITSDSNNNIVIKVAKKDTDKGTNNYTLNGVIVSGGNVSIASNITINGCLIVGGDLNIIGSDINKRTNITVNYDQGVIERVEAKNPDLFKTVFGQILVDDTDDNQNNNSTDSSSSDSASASYDLKYFLEKKLWQIIK